MLFIRAPVSQQATSIGTKSRLSRGVIGRSLSQESRGRLMMKGVESTPDK